MTFIPLFFQGLPKEAADSADRDREAGPRQRQAAAAATAAAGHADGGDVVGPASAAKAARFRLGRHRGRAHRQGHGTGRQSRLS